MKIFQNLLAKLLKKAESEGAVKTLFWLSFIESFFFPVPPDLLLIPITLARPHQWWRIALVCLIGSVLGALMGYAIGYFFMESIGIRLINFYNAQDAFTMLQGYFAKYNAWAILVAAITPIPFKIATLAAGVFHVNVIEFIIAAIIGRGVRFFGIAVVIRIMGEKVRFFLEKRLDLVLIVGTICVILGFVVIGYMSKNG